MNDKSPKNSILNIALFITIGVLIMALAYCYKGISDRDQELTDMKNSHSRLSDRQDSLFADAVRLAEIDYLVFTGRYPQALSAYQQLGATRYFITDSMIGARIAYVRMRIDSASAKPAEEPEEEVVKVDSVATDELKRQSDSIRIVYRKQADSLEQKIVELNRQVRDRNRALEQKEDLKVTVFENGEGATVHYIGETRNNMANGQGTGIWQSSGGVYKGSWLDNMRHGKGVYTWSDGVRYEGDFLNDKREGTGTYSWLSGERYEGAWKNSKRHGKGVLYDKDGNISYSGMWLDDKPKKD